MRWSDGYIELIVTRWSDWYIELIVMRWSDGYIDCINCYEMIWLDIL